MCPTLCRGRWSYWPVRSCVFIPWGLSTVTLPASQHLNETAFRSLPVTDPAAHKIQGFSKDRGTEMVSGSRRPRGASSRSGTLAARPPFPAFPTCLPLRTGGSGRGLGFLLLCTRREVAAGLGRAGQTASSPTQEPWTRAGDGAQRWAFLRNLTGRTAERSRCLETEEPVPPPTPDPAGKFRLRNQSERAVLSHGTRERERDAGHRLSLGARGIHRRQQR